MQYIIPVFFKVARNTIANTQEDLALPNHDKKLGKSPSDTSLKNNLSVL